MADKKKLEPKIVLEREYTVPLRSGWLKVAKHKRANKAVKTLKEFIVRHMKIYDRDLRKVKIDNYLNNEIRFRGMKKPPAKIKVKAKKYDNDIVEVELINLPKHIEFIKNKREKINTDIKKKVESSAKAEETKTEDKKVKTEEIRSSAKAEDNQEKAENSKNKEEASKEENLKLAKEQAKEMKHVINPKEAHTQNIGGKRASRGH